MLVDLCNVLQRGFPVLKWSKQYNPDKAIADLVAGITIGLTLIPQTIAYASLAGLGPQYGLYSSLCGGIIYAIFGTTPELNIAPTALLSLLTFSFTHNVTVGKVEAAIFLCFTSGIIEIMCGVLHLGFLVDFVSTPVVAAFTSAGALTIASSQIKNLLGLKFSATNFATVWQNVYLHIQETQKWDALLGISCCVVLIMLRKLKDFGSPPLDGEDDNKKTKPSPVKKLIWFCSVGRNAFVVISCAVAAYLLSADGYSPFTLTAQVPAGLPTFQIPISHHVNNVTVIDTMREVASGIFVIPFVAILGNVAIAKAFAKGKAIRASQEMLAVGVCNLIGSFFGSYPVNASFSRAAVSNASGVKTPLAGIYTGAIVVLALTFLTPYFPYIPKATLAAVIICAVLFMVEVTLTKLIWKIHKMDLVPFVITLLSCLFLSIEIGILIGVGVDILFLLYNAARPKVLIENLVTMEDSTNDNHSCIWVIPTSAILFPSAEYFRTKIMQNNEKNNCVVVDCERITRLDFTAAKCISSFVNDFDKSKLLIFYRPKASVGEILKKVTENGAKIAKNKDELDEMIQSWQQSRPIKSLDASDVKSKVEIIINDKNMSNTHL